MCTSLGCSDTVLTGRWTGRKSITAAKIDGQSYNRHGGSEKCSAGNERRPRAHQGHSGGSRECACTGQRQGGGSRLAEDPDSVTTLRGQQHVSVGPMLDYCDDKIIDSNTRRCCARVWRSCSYRLTAAHSEAGAAVRARYRSGRTSWSTGRGPLPVWTPSTVRQSRVGQEQACGRLYICRTWAGSSVQCTSVARHRRSSTCNEAST